MLRTYFTLVVIMFLWAVCFPLIVWGLPYAPHLTFAAMRGFLAGTALLAVALILRRPQPRGIKNWLMLAGIGVGATTLGFFGMFHASEFISPGIATVITNTQPLMAAVLAALVLRERIGSNARAGLWLGFLGIVLIAIPGLSDSLDNRYVLGISYIALSAFGISVSNVLISKMAGQIDALSAMGWQLLLGSIVLAGIALVTEDVTAVNWSPVFIASLLGLALPGTAVVYWLWMVLLEKMPLHRANAFSFLVPVFGLIMGTMLFMEQFGIMAVAGTGLTLAGIYWVNRSARR